MEKAPIVGIDFKGWLNLAPRPESSALSLLWSLWGQKPNIDLKQELCEKKVQQTLRCYAFREPWSRISSLNHPAVLVLNGQNNEPRYLLLVKLDQSQAVFLSETGEIEFPLEEVLKLWSGKAIIASPIVFNGSRIIGPLNREPIIAWVKEKLGVIDSNSDNLDFYDFSLKPKVVEFQASKGLKADGQIGIQTLISLESLNVGADEPKLNAW